MAKRRKYRLHGVTKTVPEWAAQAGLSKYTVWKRLAAGWPIEEALTAPLDARGRDKKCDKQRNEFERQLTQTIRGLVREAEQEMSRIARRLAKSLAFEIDVRKLADSLHGPGVDADFVEKHRDRTLSTAQETT